jgi:hypothetical protein
MITLVLTGDLSMRMMELSRLPVETGGVLLARPVQTPRGDLRLLGTEFFEVPESAYVERSAYGLRIASNGFVPPLRMAESGGCVPLWVHTHPGQGSSPHPSDRDELVDKQLSDLFRGRSGSEYYGSVVFASTGHYLTFTGVIADEQSSSSIDRLWVVSDRFAMLAHDGTPEQITDTMFDRNIRAFGEGVQNTLSQLTVGIVGCGGTGSAVVEQLVRLGVRSFILIDPDILSNSNLTRVYGSHASDVGRLKVDVQADNLQAIAPDVRVTVLAAKITSEYAARKLLDADLVFGCTDDNAGRLVLSRLATYALTPVIDCGVILSSDQSTLTGIFGRVTVLHPGVACLICRGRIDLRRAGAEVLPEIEQQSRAREGYAPELGDVEPAVVTFTTAVAAQAVTEVLERLTGFGPTPPPSEVLLRIHDREISTNRALPRERHYCHPASGKLGLGVTTPFLEMTWGS